jgi:hypothetical protein
LRKKIEREEEGKEEVKRRKSYCIIGEHENPKHV